MDDVFINPVSIPDIINSLFFWKEVYADKNPFSDALEESWLLELETDPDDRGRVIGRQGRVAKSIRAVLGASRDGADCRLDIVD